MAILNPLDVPCGPIMSTEDLANDEHVRGRDMWVELDHPQRGKWWNVGMPIKLSASPAVIKRSPLLGEHTDEVLKEVLGLRRREGRRAQGGRRVQRAAEESGLTAVTLVGALTQGRSAGSMKIAIIGQQDFGKAVLEAFLARGDEVAGVFCAPEKEGAQARPAARRGAGEGPEGVPVPVAARARGACRR